MKAIAKLLNLFARFARRGIGRSRILFRQPLANRVPLVAPVPKGMSSFVLHLLLSAGLAFGEASLRQSIAEWRKTRSLGDAAAVLALDALVGASHADVAAIAVLLAMGQLGLATPAIVYNLLTRTGQIAILAGAVGVAAAAAALARRVVRLVVALTATSRAIVRGGEVAEQLFRAAIITVHVAVALATLVAGLAGVVSVRASTGIRAAVTADSAFAPNGETIAAHAGAAIATTATLTCPPWAACRVVVVAPDALGILRIAVRIILTATVVAVVGGAVGALAVFGGVGAALAVLTAVRLAVLVALARRQADA